MSINYTQKMIIGVSLERDDLKVITQQKEYELQNRYDTKTGKVIKQEKVLIKDEEYHFEFLNKKYEDFYDISDDFPELTFYEFDEYGILGLEVIKPDDCGRADLIRGELDLDEIKDIFNEVKEVLPHFEIKCYLDYSIG